MKKRKILPPTYFVSCFLLAVGLHFTCPVAQLIYPPLAYGGFLLLAIGVWLNLWADNLFKKNRTTVKPFEKSSALILKGPFRFSRHPMYLGMLMALLGVAVFLGSLSSFFAPIIFFLIINVLFILREEKAMEKTFGKKYLDYKKQVRRWA